MATATRSKAPRKGVPRRREPPTLGPLVSWWIERHLVHGEGDFYGKPFVLRPWQRVFIDKCYELRPDGTRRYRRVLLGLPKGNGKTELAAALALAELWGPVSFKEWRGGLPWARRRVSPDIPIAAASMKQANLVFGAAATMVEQGPLAKVAQAFDTRILLRRPPGELYRVAAEAGTNDGAKPSFFVADELHEWTGTKERVHLVLSNNRAKRAEAWELAITTAGWDAQSLLGVLYRHGLRVAAGEEADEEFLMVWYEAPADADLSTEAGLRKAIAAANPAAGDFLPVENLVARFRQIPEFEFRRYHLNQWTTAPDRWLPTGAWAACAAPEHQLEDGARLTLGFDGSFSRDATAIVGCTEDRHLAVLGLWEKPVGAGDDWRVSVPEVEEALRALCRRYAVSAVGCDPYLWREVIGKLLEEGLPIIEWPSHQAAHMVPACGAFYEGVVSRRLTHDGDERLARHVGNAMVKTDSRGPRIVKDHKDSPRRIDLAVAAIIAHDLVVRQQPAPRWRAL